MGFRYNSMKTTTYYKNPTNIVDSFINRKEVKHVGQKLSLADRKFLLSIGLKLRK